eukprot:6171893-Pleurochrysis_carterae.AAC.1
MATASKLRGNCVKAPLRSHPDGVTKERGMLTISTIRQRHVRDSGWSERAALAQFVNEFKCCIPFDELNRDSNSSQGERDTAFESREEKKHLESESESSQGGGQAEGRQQRKIPHIQSLSLVLRLTLTSERSSLSLR